MTAIEHAESSRNKVFNESMKSPIRWREGIRQNDLDRKMWTEKYGFGTHALHISVLIFLSFAF